ncbi:Syncoilin [Oryzias melastigma]|uniref:Syncoilin n=1 Tax=Oryzias melastigma TaxID=30732 RepID=A0A834C6R3_ORYME|nr:Syncoilin [Oryzias melastigma]
MDDSQDDRPSGLSPLFIQEEDSNRSVMEHGESSKQPSGSAEARLKDSAQMKPYLQEMDDLLKSCSELTGISVSSHRKERAEVSSEASEESSFQAYLSTSYIDTHMDGARAGSEPGLGSRGGATEASPLTSAGSRLSQSMVEYESQLMGMLAMLERCMEEAGMDFEPQDWTPDSAQEYVHISKNPRCYRGTTLRAFIPEEMDTHPTQSESSPEEDTVSMDDESKNQENPPLSCQKMDRFTKEKLNHPPVFMFSGLLLSTEKTGEHSGFCDETPETGLSGIDSQEAKSQEIRKTFSQESALSRLGNLDSAMDVCIDQVEQLERKRRELLEEVLRLRSQKDKEEEEEQSQNEEESEELMESKVVELMSVFRKEEEARREERKREIQGLKEDRAEEEKKVWKMDLERQGLQEQIRTLKSRLFSLVRDCVFSQAALNHQRRQLELQKREEERLQGLLLQLTEDGCRLRSEHQQHLKELQTKLDALNSRSCSSQEELGRCRRRSCGDVEQFMQRERKALEDRFEPILLALLKRRDATAGALLQAKEQSQELRGQLTPLREEVQKLLLQRACLGEKVKLIQLQRQEEAQRFKEKVFHLEENSRTIRMELEIQRRKNKEMEETREILSKQLLLHRAANEDGNDQEEKT